MFVSEVYESFQGEGPFAETPSLFIRTSGCNLRCSFCDTPYTSWHPEGDQIELEELADQIHRSSVRHVVLTGGEPMLAPQLPELSDICRAAGHTITIETAGTVDRAVECDLMAISPKLKNSVPDDPTWQDRHEQTRHQPAVIRALFERYQAILKFVVDDPRDVDEIHDYLAQFPQIAASDVWLMPQARTRSELRAKSTMVREAAQQAGFHYSPRLHVERFGDQRGV